VIRLWGWPVLLICPYHWWLYLFIRYIRLELTTFGKAMLTWPIQYWLFDYHWCALTFILFHWHFRIFPDEAYIISILLLRRIFITDRRYSGWPQYSYSDVCDIYSALSVVYSYSACYWHWYIPVDLIHSTWRKTDLVQWWLLFVNCLTGKEWFWYIPIIDDEIRYPVEGMYYLIVGIPFLMEENLFYEGIVDVAEEYSDRRRGPTADEC